MNWRLAIAAFVFGLSLIGALGCATHVIYTLGEIDGRLACRR